MKITKKTPEEILRLKKTPILNFLNLYSLYLYNNEPEFKEALKKKENFIFPDGRILSLFIGTKQIRGPSFTKNFLKNYIHPNQKHFFITGPNFKIQNLTKQFPNLKKTKTHIPSYIKNNKFEEKEIKEIIKKLKENKPDFVWVCIGNPKQEILANQLHEGYRAIYFNVGAAIDYLVGTKKEAPVFFRAIGLEWLYRLMTDFTHSKEKVKKSFIGLRYIKKQKQNKTE